MTKCWWCGISDVYVSNSKCTYRGKKNGKRVQKTVRICDCCGAWMNDNDIKEEVKEAYGWD